MKGQTSQFSLYVFIVIFPYGLSVPHEYCLPPMNKSDCGYRPTAVFSYYKPGSRCEIEIWKGCPTSNKFDDEFICSHYCIAKVFDRQGEDKFDANADPCEQLINTNNCGGKPTQVFTYANGVCTEAIWRGCPTLNKYKDKKTCEITCVKDIDVWKEGVEKLGLPDIKIINEILDDVIEEIGAEKDETPTAIVLSAEKEEEVEEEVDKEEEVEEEEEEEEVEEEEASKEEEATREDLLLPEDEEKVATEESSIEDGDASEVALP